MYYNGFPHAVDFSQYKPGDVISCEIVEGWVGVSITDRAYSRLAYSVAMEFERRLKEYFPNDRVVCKIANNCVLIMQKKHAVPYLFQQKEAGYRKVRKQERRLFEMNTDGLSAKEARSLERAQEIWRLEEAAREEAIKRTYRPFGGHPGPWH